MSISSRRAARPEASTSQPVEMCSVRVGEMLLGLPIRQILEIVGSVRPQPVPLAPPFVGGLIHYRGDVLTTVSLRHLLGMPVSERSQATLVLESPTGCYGVLVDAVGEVMTLSPGTWEPNPSTLDKGRTKIFTGAYKLENSLLVIVDPAQLDPQHLAAEAA
jgi:purine-binding chemotaxis protein CheW